MLVQECLDRGTARASPPIVEGSGAHGVIAMPLAIGSDAGTGVLVVDQELKPTLTDLLGNFVGTFEVEIYDGSALLFELDEEPGPSLNGPGAHGEVIGRPWTFKAQPYGGGSTADQGPLPLEPGILKPTQLQQAAPTACVLDDLEGDTGLLNGRHGHWHLRPVILGAMTEPLEGLSGG